MKFFGSPSSAWGSIFSLGALSLIPSIWTPVLAAEGKTAADYYVRSLPGAPEGPLLKMHAGHIAVTPENHGNLFFWFYQNRHIGDRQRTVIWLNGGPGCSSMDGALMEIGPYRVREGGKLEYNDGSWDEFANLLFVDNPVGTGFSYVDSNGYISELQTAADQFVLFLDKWFELFPEYVNDEIYIAGESYAGQYIPYFAKTILDRNKNTATLQKWNISGLLIGNGWISPNDQYFSYMKYAYKEGLIQDGTDIARRIGAQQDLCVKELSGPGKGRVDVNSCEKIMTDILEYTKDRKGPKDQRCLNMYDIRLRDDDSCGMNWPPDLADVTPYLRRKDVVAALHIDPDKKTGWSECSGAVSSHFRALKSVPAIDFLPGVVEQVPTILFSGDRDFICNHLGTEELIKNMEWSGGKGFETSPGTYAPRRDWEFEGEPAGFYQSARNLTYVLFYNSSHMVPFDYPRRTRDMLDRFMGVDIASVGGQPVDSQLDGEKAGPETSVGGHPNSTAAAAAEKEKLQQASWRAYQRSGEVALVVIILAALAWAAFVYRERRRRAGYTGLFDASNNGGGPSALANRAAGNVRAGLESLRRSAGARAGDLEAADFDAHELEESISSAEGAGGSGRNRREKKYSEDMQRDRYSIGDDESEDEDADDEKGRR